jgi:hypothetical protein
MRVGTGVRMCSRVPRPRKSRVAHVNFPLWEIVRGAAALSTQHAAPRARRSTRGTTTLTRWPTRPGGRETSRTCSERVETPCFRNVRMWLDQYFCFCPRAVRTLRAVGEFHPWLPVVVCRALCKLPLPSRSATAGRGGKRSRGSGQQRL